MAYMPQVAIPAVNLLAALRDGNAMCLCIIKAVFTRLQRPFAPGSDNLQLRRKRLISMLETNLVISLAGAAMCNGFGALFESNRDLVLRDNRVELSTCQAGICVRRLLLPLR